MTTSSRTKRAMVDVRLRLLCIGLLCSANAAHASWLQVCDTGPLSQDGRDVVLPSPDGPSLYAAISSTRPSQDCSMVKLPVTAEAILALYPITEHQRERIKGKVTVLGNNRNGSFVVSTVFGQRGQMQNSYPMPLLENLLKSSQAKEYGNEVRAVASLENGQLMLDCKAGEQPAGVNLHASFYLPAPALNLHVAGEGKGKFEILASDSQRANKEAPISLGYIQPDGSPFNATYALPKAGLNRSDWRFWSVACPKEEARLRIRTLKLLPQQPIAARRSTWIWEADFWQKQPDAVFRRADKYGIKTLFITVPIAGSRVKELNLLKEFIRRASARNMNVIAVDGDPHMIMPDQQEALKQRAAAYAVYNSHATPDAKLDGVQFDVEPYLLPSYNRFSHSWDALYLTMVRNLRSQMGDMPVELVVPFWWGEKTGFFSALAPLVSSLTVMDYRTKAKEIYDYAVPFLDWGLLHQIPVRIALESGPAEAETKQHYEEASKGRLWLVTVGGAHFMLLLKKAQANPLGPAYRLTQEVLSDGSQTSFQTMPGRLQELLPELEAIFAAWPSFHGIALHEVR